MGKTLGLLMEILVILSRFPLYSTTRSPFSTLSVFLPLKFLPDSVRNWSFWHIPSSFVPLDPLIVLFLPFYLFIFLARIQWWGLGIYLSILSRCLQALSHLMLQKHKEQKFERLISRLLACVCGTLCCVSISVWILKLLNDLE